MRTRTFLDWLSFTVKIRRPYDFLDLWNDVPRWFNTRRALWTNAKALYGYTVAISMGVGILAMCHPGKPEMGVHVQLSGQGLEELNLSTIKLIELLAFVENSGGNVTRVDLAIDAFDSKLSIEYLAFLLEEPTTEAATRKHLYMANSEGGETLYIGSEASDRRLRAYNKAAERLSKGADIGDNTDWIRIELVLRGDKAKAFASMLCKRGGYLPEVVKEWVQGFVKFNGSEAWKNIMGDSKSVAAVSHRKITNSQKWLLSTVTKALAREMFRDEQFRERFKERLEAEIYELQQAQLAKAPSEENSNFGEEPTKNEYLGAFYE